MSERLKTLAEGLHHLAAGVLAVVGGAFGYFDGQAPGLVAGVVVGCLFGELLGFLGGWVITLCVFEKESVWKRTFRLLFCSVVIAALVVVLHDAYWFANMGAITVNYNTGASLTQATARGDSREFLRDGLKNQRWQLAIVSARPMRWLLTDETHALNQANLEFVDFLQGKGVERPGAEWKESLKTKAVTALWRSDNWGAQMLTNKALNAYGGGVCRIGREEIEKHQARGWLLRFLPKEWFQS